MGNNADPEGDRGSRPPPLTHTHTHLKDHTNVGFLSNTGLDCLKITKTIKLTFNVGTLSASQ